VDHGEKRAGNRKYGSFKEKMLKRRWTTGNRSSPDEGGMVGTEDDSTVVEPEQGNGEYETMQPPTYNGIQ
jgi:hypothetical protein